jgi:hypothetical protein
VELARRLHEAGPPDARILLGERYFDPAQANDVLGLGCIIFIEKLDCVRIGRLSIFSPGSCTSITPTVTRTLSFRWAQRIGAPTVIERVVGGGEWPLSTGRRVPNPTEERAAGEADDVIGELFVI